MNKIIYRRRKLITFLSLFIFSVVFSSTVYSQGNFSYQDYFPKQKVDSIEWYYGNIPSKKDSTLNLQLDKEIYYRDEIFPFQNLKILKASYFEKRATLTDNSDIEKLVEVLPIDSCESYPIWRCSRTYRDILVFYKDGKPISVLKICFSCQTTCFVSSDGKEDKNAKCLSNPVPFKAIAKEWIRRGWIDLRKSR
ncbi:hypothetical protein WAF17_12550 [Bernardetia sp. ABR2-2B]|uniref:hypothetical protein n=1 Tax=Bernardetia sp. ABR2-2B TaxID=3127472 RepID=UPI0030CAA6B5